MRDAQAPRRCLSTHQTDPEATGLGSLDLFFLEGTSRLLIPVAPGNEGARLTQVKYPCLGIRPEESQGLRVPPVTRGGHLLGSYGSAAPPPSPANASSVKKPGHTSARRRGPGQGWGLAEIACVTTNGPRSHSWFPTGPQGWSLSAQDIPTSPTWQPSQESGNSGSTSLTLQQDTSLTGKASSLDKGLLFPKRHGDRSPRPSVVI